MLRFLQGIVYCLWAIPLMLLMALPDLIMWSSWGSTYSWQRTGLACLLIFLVVGLGAYLAKRWGYLTLNREFLSWKTTGIIGLSYSVVTGVNFLCHHWLEALGKSNTANTELILEEIANQPVVFVFLSTTILPAILEEVICRGLFMTKLFGRNSWLAIGFSSLIFATLHGPTDLPSWVIYGSSGMVMGYLYKRTGNLAYPMALHFLNNALATWNIYF